MTTTTAQHVFDCRIGSVFYKCKVTVFPDAKKEKHEDRWCLSRNDVASMITEARNNGATNYEITRWMVRGWISRLIAAKTK
jgi:hypothetical protein